MDGSVKLQWPRFAWSDLWKARARIPAVALSLGCLFEEMSHKLCYISQMEQMAGSSQQPMETVCLDTRADWDGSQSMALNQSIPRPCIGSQQDRLLRFLSGQLV